MKSPAAFQATYADWRLVKGRKVCQIILEVPLEAANAVLDVLGGMPDPAQSLWLGVARLNGTASAVNPELPSPSSHQTSPGNFDATGGVSPPLPGTDGRKPGTQSKPWSSMSPAQQAGILCNEKDFRQFISMHYGDAYKHLSPAEFVRELCGVKSRKDIASNHKSRVIWHQLVEDYRVWQRYPEMVP